MDVLDVTFSYRCGNNNEYLHKFAAIEVLDRIVNGDKTNTEDKISVIDYSLV